MMQGWLIVAFFYSLGLLTMWCIDHLSLVIR